MPIPREYQEQLNRYLTHDHGYELEGPDDREFDRLREAETPIVLHLEWQEPNSASECRAQYRITMGDLPEVLTLLEDRARRCR